MRHHLYQLNSLYTVLLSDTIPSSASAFPPRRLLSAVISLSLGSLAGWSAGKKDRTGRHLSLAWLNEGPGV